jgi:hypothetical protein
MARTAIMAVVRGIVKIGLVVCLLSGCAPEPAQCVLDIGVDIANFPVHAYNNALRGMTGTVNVTYTCPNGGTAHITGTVSPNGPTYNITMQMTNCADNANHPVTLNGQMTSTFDGSVQVTTGTAVHIDSMQPSCKADPVDASCNIDVTANNANVDDVSICDLTYP